MFCVALGFGITSAFFISFSSFVGTSVRMVEQNSWDLAVDFVAPVWNENLDAIEKIPGIGASTPYTKGVAQAVRTTACAATCISAASIRPCHGMP
ncbi:hypothetical protein LP420_39355 [Massilia sp. B-10]|nr:hypothetical protein LP420_39355 [Massilia sp. B-10]